MKTILLFGSTGFVGSLLKKALLEKNYEIKDPRIEVRNLKEVEEAMDQAQADYVINAAGVTGKPNVDWCETHPAETYGINVSGSINIAAAAHQRNLNVMQICSGCIYDGDNEGKGYSENDEPNFFGSLYSRSRVLSEKALKEFPHMLQLRIRIPLIGKPHRKNLIDKLLIYPQMINQNNSCTVMEDFIPAAITLMEKEVTGVFNMTNIGYMNHVGIMTMYKEMVDPTFKIQVMEPEKEAELNKRRSNTILTSEKREAMGAHMPPLDESLKRILKEYKAHKNG